VDLFEDSVRKYGDAVAYECMGKKMTFRELDKFSTDFAAYLQKDLKLKRGDRVAIQMPNCLQYPVAMFGVLRAGMIVVNTNPLYTAAEMKHQFADAGVSAIVIVANFASNLQTILNDIPSKHVILTELGDMLGGLKGLIVNFVVKHIKKMIPAFDLPNAVSWKQVMNSGGKLSFQK
jgi:long-chain acyl-CoA synthetase